MMKTVAFVTNQYSCDRIIAAAKEVADTTSSELVVVGIMDNQYELDAKAVDYLFTRSKEKGATMRLIFREDTMETMEEVISLYDSRYIVSGMPSSNKSVLYELWRGFPEKDFYTVDPNGKIVEVALTPLTTAR